MSTPCCHSILVGFSQPGKVLTGSSWSFCPSSSSSLSHSLSLTVASRLSSDIPNACLVSLFPSVPHSKSRSVWSLDPLTSAPTCGGSPSSLIVACLSLCSTNLLSTFRTSSSLPIPTASSAPPLFSQSSLYLLVSLSPVPLLHVHEQVMLMSDSRIG
ncbi:hypothetical protein BJY52DRAFT_1284940 [Lactarius psammicola]|nr:hypothetical protein BJY52DRAFT_1284940 [Lactarius psammicola]